MKKDCILDLGYKAVQQSGKTNMGDRKAVQYWAHQLGFIEFVLWLQDCSSSEYIALQRSIDFSKPIDLDIEYLLENDADFALSEVRNLFEEKVEECRGRHGFEDYNEIPFLIEEFKKANQNIFQFLLENAPLHPMNYLAIGPNNRAIAKFKEEETYYLIDNCSSRYYDVSKLTVAEWKSFNTTMVRKNPDNEKKLNQIDEEMRFAVLFHK